MVSTSFLELVASNIAASNAAALIDFIYTVGVIAAKGIMLGESKRDCPDPALSARVQQNLGARSITAMSVHRVFDPTAALTLEGTTPALTYKARVQKGLTKAQLSGVIGGSVVGVLFLVVVVAFALYCVLGDGRDSENAPKQPEDPVTLIFTDIGSSTALCATLPQLIPDALATHRRVIRAAGKKHWHYEVKTIGDCFVVECRAAHAAVRPAKEARVKLTEHDWRADELDETYRMFEVERAQEDEEKKPHAAQLSQEVYSTMWHGLRVRVGVQTALLDIRLEEATGGYDYYGETPDMAARTGAVANGGQAMMTETTWWSFSGAARGEHDSTKMVLQGLRGVPYAVETHQPDPVEGREHCKLRTGIDAVLPGDEPAYTGGAADDGASGNTNMSPTATAVAFMLASCFSTYPSQQCELQPLLRRWNIAAPPRSKKASDEDYCKGLFDRPAVRVGRVAEARIRLNGSGGRTMSSLLPSMGGLRSQVNNPLGNRGSYIHQSSAAGAWRRSLWLRVKGVVNALQTALLSAVA